MRHKVVKSREREERDMNYRQEFTLSVYLYIKGIDLSRTFENNIMVISMNSFKDSGLSGCSRFNSFTCIMAERNMISANPSSFLHPIKTIWWMYLTKCSSQRISQTEWPRSWERYRTFSQKNKIKK